MDICKYVQSKLIEKMAKEATRKLIIGFSVSLRAKIKIATRTIKAITPNSESVSQYEL